MRTMYDSVTVANIPADATLVAGYVNGYYTNVAQLRARFPHATVVGISVTAKFNAGTVLDVEQGDARPDEAPDWVLMRRAAGIDPTVYCNTSTWSAVREAFISRHLPEPHYWIAHYDNIADIPAGAVAKQYADKGAYDLSAVADHWPGVDPTQEMDMTPEEHQLLADLHKTLVPAAGWGYKGPDAGGGTDGVDVHQRLVNTDNNSVQILGALKGVHDVLGQILAALPKPAGAPLAAAVAADAAAAAPEPADGGYTPPSA